MIKYFFLLFLFPFVSFGQNKKELKQMILEYQDTVSNLRTDLDASHNSEQLLISEITKKSKQFVDSENENAVLKKSENSLASSLNSLTKKNSALVLQNDERGIKINTLETQIESQLLLYTDSIEKLRNELLMSELKSPKVIITNSKFSKNNLLGSWNLITLALSDNYGYNYGENIEYLDFNSIYGYNRNYKNSKYDRAKVVIKDLTFTKPNICSIKLANGNTITCLYELDRADSRLKSNFKLKLVNTVNAKISISFSKYNENYIYSYNLSDIESFFGWNNGYDVFRVKNVDYETDYKSLESDFKIITGIVQ